VVSTSARTPEAFTRALERYLPAGARLYEWRRDDPGNPYFAMLAAAQLLVVSGDSVAMLSEAAASGKPVFIWDVPVDADADSSLAAAWYRFMMRWLPPRLTRDVGRFHRAFIDGGLGLPLAAGLEMLRAGRPVAAPRATAADDGTLARLRALLASDHASPAGSNVTPPRSTR
jgi:hypothetical protein